MKVRSYRPIFCDTRGVIIQRTNEQMDRGERAAFTSGRSIPKDMAPNTQYIERMCGLQKEKTNSTIAGNRTPLNQSIISEHFSSMSLRNIYS
jgi:hypothetical protein